MANPRELEASLDDLELFAQGFGRLSEMYVSVRVATEEAAIPEDAWPLAAKWSGATEAYGKAVTSLRDAASAGVKLCSATNDGLMDVIRNYDDADAFMKRDRIYPGDGGRPGEPIADQPLNTALDVSSVALRYGASPALLGLSVLNKLEETRAPFMKDIGSRLGMANVSKALKILSKVKAITALAGGVSTLAISFAEENVRSFEPFEVARDAWRKVAGNARKMHTDIANTLLPAADKSWSGDASNAFFGFVRTHLLPSITTLIDLADHMAALCEAIITCMQDFLSRLIPLGLAFLSAPAVLAYSTAPHVRMAATVFLVGGLATLTSDLVRQFRDLTPEVSRVAEEAVELSSRSRDKAGAIDKPVTQGRPIKDGWKPQS